MNEEIEDCVKYGLELLEHSKGNGELIRALNDISIELYKTKRDETGKTNEFLENYIKERE